MTEPIKNGEGQNTETSKIVEKFFVEIEDKVVELGKIISTFVKAIVKIKIARIWQQEKSQIQEKIARGIDNVGKAKTNKSK